MFGRNHEKPAHSNPIETIGDVPHSGEPVLDEFDNTELHEVESHLLKTLEENTDTSAIDPDTLEVDFVPYRRTEAATEPQRTPWYTRTGSKVAGAALALTAVVAGGATLVGGDDKADEPRGNNPSATAGENQSNPETLKGIKDLNTAPTPEQLRLAETPVTSKKYPTVEKAYVALQDRLNIYAIGATMDFEPTPPVETPESLESKERLADVIFGPDHETRAGFTLEARDAVRERVGLKFYYFSEFENKEVTFQLRSTVSGIEETFVPGATEAYIVSGVGITETNLAELDPTQTDFNEMVANPGLHETTVILAPDGNWYIQNIHTLN